MTGWCFALINGKLAEIFFERRGSQPKIFGHCIVKIEEYKTRKEQQYIKGDTAKFQFTYRRKKYLRITTAT